MNKYNILLGIIISLLLVPFISAEYLPHKQNQDLSFSITSNNASSCNVSSYDYLNGTIFVNQEMTKSGQTFNSSFDSGNFSSVGTYCFNIECYDGSTYETGSLCREVTPSGSQINSGKSISIFGSLLLIALISLIFFFIGYKTENNVGKISFYAFSAIGFIMTILYTVIVMQQTLFGFDSILTGIETFWFVAKTLVWIGFVSFLVVIFMIMLKAWRIKRGLIDVD